MVFEKLLAECDGKGGSDLFVIPGAKATLKVNDSLVSISDERLSSKDTYSLLCEIYGFADRGMEKLHDTGDDDFSFSMPGSGRFRCSAYRQRNTYAVVLRVVSFELPKPEDFNIRPEVMDLVRFRKGLVLVTGPAGSGKSTTLACLVDKINRERDSHIITIEDPIEFIHHHNKSIVSQRELNSDTHSYASALRAALRQSPNVILVGEMRDYETIQTVLTAAETGQLVLSTLHTVGTAKTIDRIIDVFPANQQSQIRTQLSLVLQAVVSQQLIPAVDGSMVPAFEVMVTNSAVRNMIREVKDYQIENVIASGGDQGMRKMDDDIFRLYSEGQITMENALQYASSPYSMKKKLGIE